jgi:cytochrome P450
MRRCIGASFAQFEARILLDELTKALEFTPAQKGPERVWRRGSVLVPARGARLVATRR